MAELPYPTHQTSANTRIGDQERTATAELLGDHFAAGRLTQSEYEERVETALQARTSGQLAAVLADLPAPAPAPQSSKDAVPARADSVGRKARLFWQTAGLAPWALFSVFFVMLWLFTGAGYFWPVWPIMGWGLGVALSGVVAYRMPELYLERQRAKQQCRGAFRPIGR